jgi:hypothetical protein
VVVGCILTGGGSADAAGTSGSADGTYTVTVTRVEMSQDGTNFTTVFNGSKAINIAGVNAGALAAGLVSGVSVAPGTYTTVRVTIGATLLAKGHVNISGRTFYTNGGTDTNAFSNVAGNDQEDSQSNYAIATFTIPADNRTSSQSVSFTINPTGSPPTVSVAFDTGSVFTNNNGSPSLGPPSVTMSAG